MIRMDARECPKAWEVLLQVNELVAKAFLKQPREIKVTFRDGPLAVIKKKGKTMVQYGECNTETGEIELAVYPGWPNTAVHELAHLYEPQATERRIVLIKNDLVRYLRLVAK